MLEQQKTTLHTRPIISKGEVEWILENFADLPVAPKMAIPSPVFVITNDQFQCKFYPITTKATTAQSALFLYYKGTLPCVFVDCEVRIKNKAGPEKDCIANMDNIVFGVKKGNNIFESHGWPSLVSRTTLLDPQNGFLIDGNITFVIKIRAKVGLDCTALSPSEDTLDLSSSLASLLDTPLFTDFALTTENGEKVETHKAVLAGRSSVFKAMLTSDMQESQEGSLCVPEVDREQLVAFTRFLYTGKVNRSDMTNHCETLFTLADKYDISSLRRLCESQLKATLKHTNCIRRLLLADQHGSQSLIHAVSRFVSLHVQHLPKMEGYSDLLTTDRAHLIDTLYRAYATRTTKRDNHNTNTSPRSAKRRCTRPTMANSTNDPLVDRRYLAQHQAATNPLEQQQQQPLPCQRETTLASPLLAVPLHEPLQ